MGKVLFWHLWYLTLLVLHPSDAGRIDILQNQIHTLITEVFNLKVEVNAMKQNAGSVVENCSCPLDLEEKVKFLTLELQNEKERNQRMEDQISSLLQQQQNPLSERVSSRKVELKGTFDVLFKKGVKDEKQARINNDNEHDERLARMEENIMAMNQSIDTRVVNIVRDCDDKIDVVNNSLAKEMSSCNDIVAMVLTNVSTLMKSVSQEEELNIRQSASIDSLERYNRALVSLFESQLYNEWSEWEPCRVTDTSLNRGQQTRSKRCLNITDVPLFCSEKTEVRNCSTEIRCPSDYEKLAGFSICVRYYENSWVTLAQAQRTCSSDNGHIVLINSEEKQSALQEYLDGKYSAGYDILIDGRRHSDGWKNSDGELMTYFDWKRHFPSRNEAYTYLFFIGKPFKWRNGPSTYKTRILCEITYIHE